MTDMVLRFNNTPFLPSLPEDKQHHKWMALLTYTSKCSVTSTQKHLPAEQVHNSTIFRDFIYMHGGNDRLSQTDVRIPLPILKTTSWPNIHCR